MPLSRTSSVATGISGFPSRLRQRTASFAASRTSQSDGPLPYLSWTPTIGRNSAFADLTAEQREELGGIEYRSLKTLASILVAYYVGFHALGVVILLPWLVRSAEYGAVVDADNQNRAWWLVVCALAPKRPLTLLLGASSRLRRCSTTSVSRSRRIR